MSPHESHKVKTEAEWRAQLATLASAPTPDLKRGRARVMAEAYKRLPAEAYKRLPAAPTPRRATFALALGISVAVILVMVIMSSAMGAFNPTDLAMTRTEIAQTLSPVVVPANALTRAPNNRITLIPEGTPIPNLVPEPPHSPVSNHTETLLP